MKPLSRMLLTAAVSLLVTGTAVAWAESPRQAGEIRPYRSESPHPYGLGTSARPVVWTDRVVSPGASFIRVHFTGLDLAPGDRLTVSSPDGSRVWTYTGKGPRGNGDLWAFAIDGDTAVVRIYGGRGVGQGYRIDAIGHGTERLAPVPEVICSTDGREDVACHLRESGFAAAQAPVARLLFPSGGFLYLCTGWLAAGPNGSTLVTNNHCIDKQSSVDGLQATFNYQNTKCGGAVLATSTDYAGGLLLKTNNVNRHGHKMGLDYTLLTLQGDPEATWGELTPSTRALAIGDPIWFIEHGGGGPKQVGYYEDADHAVRCQIRTVDQTYGHSAVGSQAGYTCDSEGGSSGSPIVDSATGHVISLHHFGNVDTGLCLNSGTEMAAICADATGLLSCAAN